MSVSVTPFLDCYCTSGATSAANASIRNVTFSNLNNTSPTACSQYTDYSTVDTAIVNLGLTYPISILVEDCEGTTFSTQGTAVFIDWNQNGSFTDPGEHVYNPPTQPGAATVLFTGNITVPPTALTGITRMRVIDLQSTAAINPCGTYTTGETEDYLINVLPTPNDEAGVLAVTKPVVGACDLGQQLWVNLQNLGSDTLSSVNFTVTINGINIPVANPWTGSVPPLSVAEVQVPLNYVFSDGDTVNVQVSLPNGQVENPLYGFNNAIGRRIYEGLSGNKTVYGSTPDFVNMEAALSAIQLRGVCDTVYFKIANGNYAAQYTLTPYLTFNPNSLVVFESASGNAADVTFTYNGTAVADNYVFRFNAADGYMLRNLTGKNQGATYSKVIDITNGTKRLYLDGNILIGDTVAAYAATNVNRAVIGSTDNSVDNQIEIRNNTFIGGSRGISFASATGSLEEQIVVESNHFSKYSYAGVYLSASIGPVVKGNMFIPKDGMTQDVFDIYVTGTIGGGQVSRNTIHSSRKGAAIMLDNVDFLTVANNFIYLTNTLAADVVYGIEVANVGSTGILIANNSISMASTNSASSGIGLLDGSEISVYNNNIGSFGAAPALRIEKSYNLSASNNNNLFATPVASYVGTVYNTLSDYQTGTGRDAASVSVNPGFNGSDLHTCVLELNAAAAPLSQITEDYDGDTRFVLPDIGADEFLGGAEGLLLEDAILKCPDEQVVLGNVAQTGTTYTWTPSGNTSQITTTAAGTYIVVATSSCGTFSDTAVVTNKPLPTANFTSAAVGLTAIFTNTSANATSYSWNFGDGHTSTDTNPNHVYETAGTYPVTLTVTNDCGSSTFGPTLVNVINAGIEDNQVSQVLLYPNPTDGLFNIAVSGISGEFSVVVTDITGRAIMTKTVAAGTDQLTLDATSFASGTYSVRISNGEINKLLHLIKK